MTSGQAYSEANSTVARIPGGPWGLVSMQGFVADGLATPFGEDQAASQGLAGPNTWNLSAVGTLNATLWSGRSLFWQLMFMNASTSMAFVEVAESEVYEQGPIGPTNPCVKGLETSWWGMFSSEPASYWLPGSQFDEQLGLTAEALNSSDWAPTAATHLANRSAESWVRIMAVYTLGWTDLSLVDWSNATWLAWYQSCGLPGLNPYRPYAETGWTLGADPSVFYGQLSGMLSCPVVQGSPFNFTYSLEPASVSPEIIEYGLHIGFGGNGSWFYNSSADSLSAWMIEMNLNSSTGAPIPAASPNCPLQRPNLSGCAPPPSGWYAVLLSPTGWVLDTYPSTAGATSWTVPNVAVTNADTLAIVSSGSLHGSGDVFGVASNQTWWPVFGSVVV